MRKIIPLSELQERTEKVVDLCNTKYWGEEAVESLRDHIAKTQLGINSNVSRSLIRQTLFNVL